jgi:hypothetical protein
LVQIIIWADGQAVAAVEIHGPEPGWRAFEGSQPSAHPAPTFATPQGRKPPMAAFARSKILAGLAVIAAGATIALVEGCDRSAHPVVATDRGAHAVPRGESGLSRGDEQAAVAAVQAHLNEAGLPGQLRDVRLYPLGLSDEVAVCATLPLRGTEVTQIVARVVLAKPTQVEGVAERSERAASPRRPPMVILEAGPGLGRGGSQMGPEQRYCRLPKAPEAVGAEAPVESGAQAVVEHALRLMVVSPARVRALPAGDAPVLWIAPRGRSYAVLGNAPGGWVNIGDGEEALGWVHSSLLGSLP